MKPCNIYLLLAAAVAPSGVASFVLSPVVRADSTRCEMHNNDAIIRRDVLKASPLIAAIILGVVPTPSSAAEQKSYSSNARNMARLSSGDSSGGSLYDNNPSSPKARARRAMVGCKNASARSLAGENVGNKKLSEKECNQLVMSGDSDFMLGALTELDCPTCPYGIGDR